MFSCECRGKGAAMRKILHEAPAGHSEWGAVQALDAKVNRFFKNLEPPPSPVLPRGPSAGRELGNDSDGDNVIKFTCLFTFLLLFNLNYPSMLKNVFM